MDDFEPMPERFVRVLKDRSSNMREAIALIGSALVALPPEGRCSDRAIDALRPAARDEVGFARFFIGKIAWNWALFIWQHGGDIW